MKKPQYNGANSEKKSFCSQHKDTIFSDTPKRSFYLFPDSIRLCNPMKVGEIINLFNNNSKD